MRYVTVHAGNASHDRDATGLRSGRLGSGYKGVRVQFLPRSSQQALRRPGVQPKTTAATRVLACLHPLHRPRSEFGAI
jgi:hypothetical protein